MAIATFRCFNLPVQGVAGEDRYRTDFAEPPGTEFFGDGLPRERHDQLVANTALGRHGEVDEIADAVGFLASPAARFVTGTVLHVNGGAYRTR